MLFESMKNIERKLHKVLNEHNLLRNHIYFYDIYLLKSMQIMMISYNLLIVTCKWNIWFVFDCMLSSFSHVWFCIDCSLPGFSVHGIFHARILMGCYAILQGIFLIQGLKPGLLHLPTFLDWFFTTSTTWETPIFDSLNMYI